MFFSFVLTAVSWSFTAKHNHKEEGKEKCHYYSKLLKGMVTFLHEVLHFHNTKVKI